MLRKTLQSLLCAAALVPLVAGAKTLLQAGRIHTSDPDQAVAEAMVWDGDGRLLAVGEGAVLKARFPEARGLLSTTAGCPNDVPRPVASNRAPASVSPPGGNPTTNVMGFVGHACAAKTEGAKVESAPSEAAVMNVRRGRAVIGFLGMSWKARHEAVNAGGPIFNTVSSNDL